MKTPPDAAAPRRRPTCDRALPVIAVCRLRYDERTIDMRHRRMVVGLSTKDIVGCLNASMREVFNDPKIDLATS